jgi:Ni,Fe-hydrogenase I small subunit
LVTSAYDVPEVDILLISGGVRSDEDLHNLRQAVKRAKKIVAVGTCAISGGVTNLGNRDEVRQLFLSQSERHNLPRMLPKSRRWIIRRCRSFTCRLPANPEVVMALYLNRRTSSSAYVARNAAPKMLDVSRPTWWA